MKLVRNTGADRVIDLLRPGLRAGRQLDAMTPTFSLFAFSKMLHEMATLLRCRLLLPPASAELAVLGSDADRVARNCLQSRWVARRLVQWIENKAEVRRAPGAVPQGAFVVRDGDGQPLQALLGSLALSTDGLGLIPGNPLSLIQASVRLYFVVETKSGIFGDELRYRERAKIECGKAHFKALAVGEAPAQYIVAKDPNDLFA